MSLRLVRLLLAAAALVPGAASQSPADTTDGWAVPPRAALAGSFADLDLTRGPQIVLGQRGRTAVTLGVQLGRPPTDLGALGGGGALVTRRGAVRFGMTASHSPRTRDRLVATPAAAAPYAERTERTSWTQASAVAIGPLRAPGGALRWEALAGVHQADLDRTARTVSAAGDAADGERDLDGLDPVRRLRLGAALDLDARRFGVVSAVSGTRARAEVMPYVGDGGFVRVALGVAHAVRLAPATLAVRLRHDGAYGAAPDDPAALLALDDPVQPALLVRGYADALSLDECAFAAGGACAQERRLQGTHAATATAELRLPVSGPDALFRVRRLPAEAVLFADLGAAWTDDDPLDLRLDTGTADRVPVASLGLALRARVLGRLPVEVYAAAPLHRPETPVTLGVQVSAPLW